MGTEAADLRDGGRLKDIRAFIDSLYAYDLCRVAANKEKTTRSLIYCQII